MKVVAVAIVVGLLAGCASQQSSSPSAGPTTRPELVYKSPAECEKAGRTWNHTSGVCM